MRNASLDFHNHQLTHLSSNPREQTNQMCCVDIISEAASPSVSDDDCDEFIDVSKYKTPHKRTHADFARMQPETFGKTAKTP